MSDSVNIERADIGVSVTGTAELINAIHTKLIGETSDLIRRECTNMIDHVGTYWSGPAAEAFKQKIAYDVDAITTILDQIGEDAEKNITQIAANSAQAEIDLESQIRSTMGQ